MPEPMQPLIVKKLTQSFRKMMRRERAMPLAIADWQCNLFLPKQLNLTLE